MPAPASAKSAGPQARPPLRGRRQATEPPAFSATSTLIQPLHNRFPTPRQPSGTSTNLHPSFNRHATASQSQQRLICLTITFQPPESAKRTIPRLANTHDSTTLFTNPFRQQSYICIIIPFVLSPITNLTHTHIRHDHPYRYICSILLPCAYTPTSYLLLDE